MNDSGFGKVKKIAAVFLLSLFVTGIAIPSFAQNQNGSSEQEVYLAFHHRNIISKVVTAYYKDGAFYLPSVEMFKILQIDVKTAFNGYIKVYGTYLDNREYVIDFSSGYIEIDGKRTELQPDDYIVKEVDFFLHPSVFSEAFGLDFTVDFNNLALDLESSYTMPIVSQRIRQQKRARLDQQQVQMGISNYDLKYKRDRHFINGGFLDYSLSSNFTPVSNIYTYNTDLGMEILGGDFQGAIFGSFSNDLNTFATRNLRWRFVPENTPWLRQAFAGQINTMGLSNNLITGVKFSNEPVRSRILFDEYVVQGSTTPQSEVELYLNNSLIDFQESDELGNYRFTIPLTYGTSRLNLKVYGPSGQVRERSQRIQVPFTFLPPGDTYYNISAGVLQNPVIGLRDDALAIQSDVSTGLTSSITGTLGLEYFEGFHDKFPTVFGSISTRPFANYLVNIDAAPDQFYRVSTNAVYSSSASWGVDYTYFVADRSIYNFSGIEQELFSNFFLPFRIGSVPLNFRYIGSRQFRGNSDLTKYNFDLSTRINRLNIRTGFRDSQVGPLRIEATNTSRITSALTYTLSQVPGIPSYLRGAFLRIQSNYLPSQERLEDIEISLSKSFGQNGRLQIIGRRNFIADFNTIGLNLTIDFNKIRSTSNARTFQDNFTYTHTLRGSVGFDSKNSSFVLSNRQQVGRSGAAVKLFVDKNNTGTYEPEDEILENSAIRLSRSGGSFMDKSGTTYLTQLQSYDRYNLEINKGAIPNPLLIPEIEKFSFITDPNSYKPIEIPFYISGIIDGVVEKTVNDSLTQPVAGLRLFLTQTDGDFFKELRTFSDGGFYAYEVPPGKYELRIDSTSLDILDMRANPAKRAFEVRALAEGDFITGVNFTLIPRKEETEKPVTAQTSIPTSNPFSDPDAMFEIQLASFRFLDNAKQATRQAQLLFNESYYIKYNRNRDLHAVRSRTLNSPEEAINKLLEIQNSPFENAVLVIITDQAPASFVTEQQLAVQTGAFAYKDNARQFSRISEERLGLDTEIYYDTEEGLYKVQTVQTARQLVKARDMLRKVKRDSYFNDAFVALREQSVPVEQLDLNFAYQIHIQGVTPQSEQAYLSAITDGLATSDVDINKGPEEKLLIFKNLTDWQNVLNLKQKLSQISTVGKPFIVLIEQN